MKHLLIISFCFLFLLQGCTGEVTTREGDLGTEATEADLQDSIQKATEGISPLDAQVGQSTHMEFNARVETGAIMKLADITRRVHSIDVTEDRQSIKFTYWEDYAQFTPSGELVDEWHKERAVVFGNELQSSVQKFAKFDKRVSKTISGSTFTIPDEEPNICDGKDMKDSDGNIYDCVRYFNLKSERRRVPAPPAVANKPNCLGIPDCKFTVQFLEYDEVLWKDGKSLGKTTYRVNVAKEVPHVFPDSYLPPITSLCTKAKQDFVERKNVIVTYCRVLRNMDL